MAGALEYQSEVRPNKTAILYPDSEKDWTEYASLTYSQYNNVVYHLAERIGESVSLLCPSNESVTCGILSQLVALNIFCVNMLC
jgi:acyl-CoA synthetase (AMP-forming)/AMP-acid ligase II